MPLVLEFNYVAMRVCVRDKPSGFRLLQKWRNVTATSHKLRILKLTDNPWEDNEQPNLAERKS